ncbi:MAG: carbon starvation CstA family protein [Planctomycetia bacterium]|nr:carbon starvation CstA family protein [Planctomycetia bacterium]
MLLFSCGLLLLIVGYLTYGRFIERVLSPDDRLTPAVKYNDGVDYVVLPKWKNMMIQLLNIAGIGPVIGVIAGIKFGTIVFLLIPIGNIIGGATHDFLAGMASLRNRGSNLPKFIRQTLGTGYYGFFSVFMVFLLLLVVAVFINVPATLIDKTFVPGTDFFWGAVACIFIYYIIATLFPVDKIIGSLYPFFGAILIFGSLALLGSICYKSIEDHMLLQESQAFITAKNNYLQTNPIIPCLFVTIACGILSGFHATQSPIIARTMKSEREARASFYGMMVLEGIIAMIWAASALVVYNTFPELWTGTDKPVPAQAVLPQITDFFLGKHVGSITVIAVVVLAITSGDTAMRSLRLSLSEIFKISQQSIRNRLLVTTPLIVVVALLLWWSNQNNESFGKLWNYFAWGNQVLAASTLGGCCVWLYAMRKQGWIAIIPSAFMTFIVASFILWTSKEHKGPAGFGLELHTAYVMGAVISALFTIWCLCRGKRLAKRDDIEMEESPTYPNAIESSDSSVEPKDVA